MFHFAFKNATKSLFAFTFLFLISCSKDNSNNPPVATERPEVITVIDSASELSVYCGGEVTFTGGTNDVTRGIVWSYNPNVTASDNEVFASTKGGGVFKITIDSLLEKTTVYIRAFAENSVGRTYGDEQSIETGYGNPLGAYKDSNGCVICDNYAVGDTFGLDGKNYIVYGDKAALRSYAFAGGDLSLVCTSKITDMVLMLHNRGGLFNGSMASWDVSNVTNMFGLFWNSRDFNQDISNWDVSNVTNMQEMFSEAWSFNQDISGWDVSNVTNMRALFQNARSFNQDIGNWDVSGVTDMAYMFYTSSNPDDTSIFNQDIGNWDVSNVTNMDGMFYNSNNFNQDLSNWCVTNIPSLPSDFSTGSALTSANHPVWGTCPP